MVSFTDPSIDSILISILGKYYNYDSSVSQHHDSIMSDQLAGFWYLRLSGHKYEVILCTKNLRALIAILFFQGFRKRTNRQRP